MMTTISYNDIRYSREISYYDRLKPVFDELLRQDAGLGTKIQVLEEEFYNLLSNSVKVDNLDYVSDLLKRVLSRLNADLKVDIFIYLSGIPNALCMPRYHLKNYGQSENLVILVSQHFFNDLNPVEQASILGHEIGHFLYGHTMIPKDILLKSPFSFDGALLLKNDVLKWGICAEISGDLMGLVANGLNSEAFISAMLKFTTGLNNAAYNTLGGNHLKNTVLGQFKDITNAVHEQKLETHPITPLRLKLAEKLAQKEILKKYGNQCSPFELIEFKQALNSHIDHYISAIYPDILPDFKPKGQELLLKMAIAVSLSDRMISQKEFEMIRSFTNTDDELSKKLYKVLDEDLKTLGHDLLVRKIINECIAEGFRLKLKKSDVIQILKNLLIVAVADGFLHQAELNTIAAFTGPFDISIQEVLFLKNQMRL